MAIGDGICGWIRNPALDEENKEDDQQQLPPKEIPQPMDSAAFDCTGNNQYAGFPPLGSQPIYGSTNPYADNMNQIIGYTDPSINRFDPLIPIYGAGTGQPTYGTPVSQMCGVGGGGGGGGNTTMPPYDPKPTNPWEGCDMLVLCADGTTQEACFQTFAPLCTGRGGVYDPTASNEPDYPNPYPEDFCDFPVMRADGTYGCVDANNPAQSTGNEIIDPCAGVRCIRVYKPCPEGYLEASECCPNTGDCVPDPNYVAYGGLVQMQPISETAPVNFIGDPTTYRSGVMVDSPASQFDQTTPAAIALQDYRTQFEQAVQSGTASLTPPESQYTLLDTPPTTATSTTETPATEEPKQSGLGILVLGLIALEALAT
jgi:hypothetical protein